MKKLFLSLIAVVLFSGVSWGQDAIQFETSVVIVTKERVKGSCEKNMSAKSIQLVSFDKNLKLPKEIEINGVRYSDTGNKFDVKAEDGIYTSNSLFPDIISQNTYVLTFDGFNYEKSEEFKKLISKVATKSHIKINCHIEYFYGLPYINCDVINVSIEW